MDIPKATKEALEAAYKAGVGSAYESYAKALTSGDTSDPPAKQRLKEALKLHKEAIETALKVAKKI